MLQFKKAFPAVYKFQQDKLKQQEIEREAVYQAERARRKEMQKYVDNLLKAKIPEMLILEDIHIQLPNATYTELQELANQYGWAGWHVTVRTKDVKVFDHYRIGCFSMLPVYRTESVAYLHFYLP